MKGTDGTAGAAGAEGMKGAAGAAGTAGTAGTEAALGALSTRGGRAHASAMTAEPPLAIHSAEEFWQRISVAEEQVVAGKTFDARKALESAKAEFGF